MKKAFIIGMVVIGAAFTIGGVYTTVRGLQAKALVRAELLEQNIITPEDASIPNARVEDAATAHAMAEIIGVHAEEATGGKTYAELGRFLAADGGDTNDEAEALLDDEGNPVPNPLRNVAFQAAALQSSLHGSHLAFEVANLVIGIGVMVTVLGVVIAGTGILLGALYLPALNRRLAPAVATTTF
jgi:hypothetical protein